ncbi:MAG: acetyltransferase [Lachnospiraceae bacterium]|nr:acetyltransferase [Lachnospiraceae bacterium]
MSKNILLIGGGGHCHSVLDTLLRSDSYEKIGVIAKDADNYRELEADSIVSNYLVGIDADLSVLFSEHWGSAFITLGSIGDPSGRKHIGSVIQEIGFSIPTIIDPSAIVSEQANLGVGVFVGKNAIVNIGCRIGSHSIINTGAIIEHDCRINDFVHISPGSLLCGSVSIGEETHIGAGSVIRQCIRIGKNSLIGAGSVVVTDIPDHVTAYGNPCKVIEQ